MAKGEYSKACNSETVRGRAETDASIEPEVPNEVAAEDPIEEQNNEVEEGNLEETVEGTEAQEADVRETPRKRNRNRRIEWRRRKGKSSSAMDSSREDRKQTEISGVIFMCNAATKKDCFKHRVFGFPEAKRDVVEQVKKGMKLFLFDVDRKVLHGIYKANSEGGLDLVPEAFSESERKYPAQVRFCIHKDCMPLEQNDFKQAIKENFYSGSKFKSELTYEQVGKLMRLFRPLDSRGLPQPIRSRCDAPREPASRDTLREPELASRSSSQGPSRAPHPGGTLPCARRHVSRHAREPVYTREYSSLYTRSARVPAESDLRIQSNYAPASQATLAEGGEAGYLRLKEVETDTFRRAYAIPPTGEAILGARRRYMDELYVEQQSLQVPRRPLPHDPLYRGAEYQREMPSSSYGGLRNPADFPY